MTPISRWFPVGLSEKHVVSGFIVTLTTNAPCHLWLRWTQNPPWVHPVSVVDRGLATKTRSYWCFTAWKTIEQEEPDDTYEHTFIWVGWEICQRKYFTFKGEIGGVESPSDSPIFHLHFTISPPPEVTLVLLEPWTWTMPPPPPITQVIDEPWTWAMPPPPSMTQVIEEPWTGTIPPPPSMTQVFDEHWTS